MGAEVFHTLKRILKDRNLSTAVGDEGGFAPVFAGGAEEALDTIVKAIDLAGYAPGRDVMIALDCAASEFYTGNLYDYTKFEGSAAPRRTAEQQIAYL